MSGIKNILFLVPVHIAYESYASPPKNARTVSKGGKLFNSLATDLPLGPLSISAFIKKHVNANVKLIDFNVEVNSLNEFNHHSFREFFEDFLSSWALGNETPDIVGISSLFSPSYQNFMDLGAVSKSVWSSAYVIGGGNIPTNSYRHIYQAGGFDYFDALCFGEGEKPMLGLLQANDFYEFAEASDSWITASKIETIFAPKHDFIFDLDEIPFYDYALCNHGRHGLNPVMTSYASHEDSTGYHIMTSRGCPFLCTFCASHRVHGRKMRYHSLERVFSDLQCLIDEYSAKTIVFQDDHLMADKERVLQILSFVKEKGLTAIFQNGLTLYSLDFPMLEAFKSAGVDQLVLPIESGSEKVLKLQMRKPLKMSISQRVAEDCRTLGIYTDANILIGLPGETKEDIQEARLRLRSVPVNWFHVVCASPVVGSEIHQIATESGYITGDVLGADYRHAVINTPDFTASYIQDMQYVFNLELNFLYNSDLRLSNYTTAQTGFKNVLSLRPDHSLAHLCMAYVHLKKGDESKCSEHLRQGISLSREGDWAKFFDLMSFRVPDDMSSIASAFEEKWHD